MKFGGTSVASPEKLIDIVRKAVERDRTILVCSAISKCTDTLIRLGKLASERDEKYLAELAALQDRHHAMIASILPADRQKAVQETVDGLFDSLKGILHGVFLLGELSPTSLDAVQSFGELFSTKILAAKFSSLGLSCQWIDARDIIKTVSGSVDTAKTNANTLPKPSHNTPTRLFSSYRASLHRTSWDAPPPWAAAARTTPPRCWRRASKPVWWRSGPMCRAS